MASALDGGARSPTPEMPAELRAGYVPYVPAALQTAAGGGRQRTVAKDPLVEAAAQERELAYGEMLLVNAFEAVLHVGLEHLTPLCKEARISTQQIETHADEIGVEETLTKEQITGLGKFAQFMTLAEKLQIIKFEAEMPGRTLLGYQVISIEAKAEWRALLYACCGLGKFFRAMSTVYETLLKFGYTAPRNSVVPADAGHVKKKDRALLFSDTFTFDEERVHSNLKRYTNSQMRMQPPAKPRDRLDVLLEAARAASGGV